MSIEQVSTTADDQAVGEIKFFSPGSRINRLRYWAHSMLMAIPFYIVLGIGTFLGLKVSLAFFGLVAIAYVALIVYSFILIIQRLHDLDKSGWLSLLMFVPFANIYLLVLVIFFKGTPGRNSYGLQTPPNKTWHWVMALVVPVLLAIIIGVVAAVSMPAYQRYVEASQEAQMNSLESSDSEAVEDGVIEDEAVDAEGEELEGEGTEESSDDSAEVEEQPVEAEAAESSEAPKAAE